MHQCVRWAKVIAYNLFLNFLNIPCCFHIQQGVIFSRSSIKYHQQNNELSILEVLNP